MIKTIAIAFAVLLFSIITFLIIKCEDDVATNSIACEGISISTFDDFDSIRNNLAANYCLTTDIQMPDTTNWQPISTVASPFTGSLDGKGYTISNVNLVNSSLDNLGLFASIGQDGTVKNLTLNLSTTAANSVEGNDTIGPIAAINSGTITSVHVKGGGTSRGVNGSNHTGGLVGRNEGSIISSSSTTSVLGNIGSQNIAGLAAINSGTIENSYSTGDVEGHQYIAGLVALNTPVSVAIINSYTTSDTHGETASTSSFIAKNDKANVATNCYFIDPTGTTVGVVVGDASGIAGLKTTDITSESVFVDWNFSSIWNWKGANQWPTLK